jgi:heme/copper-type cytochrome/quinol oxidase subunit 2
MKTSTAPPWLRLSLPPVVNAVLGIPAVVPAFLLWYFASNWPLAELGWTDREPTENDGVLPWVMVATPILTLFGIVWWLANRPLRRRTALSPRAYWLLSAVATALPTLTLIVISSRRN